MHSLDVIISRNAESPEAARKQVEENCRKNRFEAQLREWNRKVDRIVRRKVA